MNSVIIIIIILALLLIVIKVERMIKRYSRSAEAELIRYAAKALKDGDLNDALASTPKSLSRMDTIFLPQIQKDFPEFNWREFKSIIQDSILKMLHAIDEQNAELVKSMPAVYADVANLLKNDLRNHFQSIQIHDTAINSYSKKDGTCYIKTSSSMEYYFYAEKDGTLASGDRNQKKQTVYDVELIYIQDVSKHDHANSLGVTCPNCGAPITNLGLKVCEYCKTAIEPINIKVWKVNSIKER